MLVKLVVQVRLLPTPEQAAALEATLCVAWIAWTFRGYRPVAPLELLLPS
jgi:hypothetical protein